MDSDSLISDISNFKLSSPYIFLKISSTLSKSDFFAGSLSLLSAASVFAVATSSVAFLGFSLSLSLITIFATMFFFFTGTSSSLRTRLIP